MVNGDVAHATCSCGLTFEGTDIQSAMKALLAHADEANAVPVVPTD